MIEIRDESWFTQIPTRPKELLLLAIELYDREVSVQSALYDYSFIVFPASKAYEGFLKHFFFSQGLISKKTYEGKRFRIGRALNPDIHPNGQDEYWLYDDLSKKCGREVAFEMWDTWLICRNQVFHFFPLKKATLTLAEANTRLEKIFSIIRVAILCSNPQKQQAIYKR